MYDLLGSVGYILMGRYLLGHEDRGLDRCGVCAFSAGHCVFYAWLEEFTWYVNTNDEI